MASLLLALPLALAGCGGSDTPNPGKDDVSSTAPASGAATSTTTSSAAVDPDALTYAALGDSYAAAPGVPTSDAAGGCFRSDHNYAHLLADDGEQPLALNDLTCSGATSDDVIAKQVPEVAADTDVVTIGIGGNDFGLFTRVVQGCFALTADPTDPAASDNPAKPCTDTASSEVAKVADDIKANMGKVLDAIAEQAPDAEIIVVGYPALLPDDGTTCPDLIPLAAGDYPFVASINEGLSNGLKGEAKERGLDYVDVFTASKGHDVCSDDPWVNGVQTAADGTIPLHPFAEEQVAVAAMIADLL